jgi:hypothetical protein
MFQRRVFRLRPNHPAADGRGRARWSQIPSLTQLAFTDHQILGRAVATDTILLLELASQGAFVRLKRLCHSKGRGLAMSRNRSARIFPAVPIRKTDLFSDDHIWGGSLVLPAIKSRTCCSSACRSISVDSVQKNVSVLMMEKVAGDTRCRP